jgi:hypothetical protein
MLPNERELFETTSDIWTVLSQTKVFETIFNMQSMSGTLCAALESPSADQFLPHLASTGIRIHEDSEELTQIIADYLARCGIKPEQLVYKE